ncbi:MAG: type II toxin-antitoxin system VapC family toxin [Myxococcota bacterium]
MRFLLDTNVLSESAKREPNQHVLTWLNQAPQSELCVSVLSLGEIYRGIEALPQSSKRKSELTTWMQEVLLPWFGDRIFPVNLPVAQLWGELQKRCPRTIPAIDLLIAATALQHKLHVVTRNARDFQDIPDIVVVNPWVPL